MEDRINMEAGGTVLLDLIYRRGEEMRVAKNVVTSYVGCEHGKYVTLRLNEPEKLHHYLATLEGMVVKYINDGKAHAFRSELVGRAYDPAPLIFVGYPSEIETIVLRKEARARCNPSVRILHRGTSISGLLVDVSQSGCRIDLPAEADGDRFVLEQPLELSFCLPGLPTDIEVEAVIRWIRKCDGTTIFGATFTGMSEEAHQTITKFLASHICSF